jgi:hypothetical protein
MNSIRVSAAAPTTQAACANRDSHHTRRRHTRLATIAVLLALGIAACAGASRKNYYASALKRQESCCDQIGDPRAAADCRAGIQRVKKQGDESDPMNRQTYYCIDRHFVCDASSGKATQASAQEQLDCINDSEAAGR